MLRAVVLPLSIACLLSACQDQAPTPAEPSAGESVVDAQTSPSAPPSPEPADAAVNAPEEADACGAEKLGRWLNAAPTDTVKAEIEAEVGHDRIRYIGPGDAVTLDFRPDRLNVETGANGRIKLFRCG